MIVLCSHESCGAVLRAASTDSPVTAVLLADGERRYFICPRCFRRTDLGPAVAHTPVHDARHADESPLHPPMHG